ncbi:MAG: hypothetical protein L0Y66_08840 [Myxococcaceae bacterium]|nr:hypothetical protein [Myxococcaceae bacterium]
MLRAHIRLEVERGEQALTEAGHLVNAGLWYGAMSRAYYAVLHHAQKVLQDARILCGELAGWLRRKALLAS